MLEARLRNILFLDSIITPYYKSKNLIDLGDILRLVEDANSVDGYVKLVDNEQAAIRIMDIDVNLTDNIATLLISYADKRGSDPVFANLQKGKLRTEPKMEGEGVAISAHLIFSLKRNVQTNMYPTLLEDVPGIGRTLLEPFLKSAMKSSSNYTTQNKNNKTVKNWPVINLAVKQGEKLGNSLKKGGFLREVEVTTYHLEGGFDQIPELVEKKTTKILKIENKPTGSVAGDILNKIKSLSKSKGYADMKVHWTTATKEKKQVNLGTARADAADAVFGRVEKIQLDKDLPQCCEKINKELQKKMIEKMQ